MHSSAPLAQTTEVRRPAARLPGYLAPLLLLVVAVCVVRALQLAWLADDAFISFRYARNLVDGLGLVYNAGEYVEGYTNLLWTLAIAAGLRVGWAAESFAHVLGIGCWLALVALLGARAWRRARAVGRTPLPLAAALCLLLADMQQWATGGLETSMFSLFASAGILAIASPNASRRRLLCAGLLLGLTTLTRPDGVIFAVLGVLFAPCMRDTASPRQRLADGLWVAAPLLVIGTGPGVVQARLLRRVVSDRVLHQVGTQPLLQPGPGLCGAVLRAQLVRATVCAAAAVAVAPTPRGARHRRAWLVAGLFCDVHGLRGSQRRRLYVRAAPAAGTALPAATVRVAVMALADSARGGGRGGRHAARGLFAPAVVRPGFQ